MIEVYICLLLQIILWFEWCRTQSFQNCNNISSVNYQHHKQQQQQHSTIITITIIIFIIVEQHQGADLLRSLTLCTSPTAAAYTIIQKLKCKARTIEDVILCVCLPRRCTVTRGTCSSPTSPSRRSKSPITSSNGPTKTTTTDFRRRSLSQRPSTTQRYGSWSSVHSMLPGRRSPTNSIKPKRRRPANDRSALTEYHLHYDVTCSGRPIIIITCLWPVALRKRDSLWPRSPISFWLFWNIIEVFVIRS